MSGRSTPPSRHLFSAMLQVQRFSNLVYTVPFCPPQTTFCGVAATSRPGRVHTAHQLQQLPCAVRQSILPASHLQRHDTNHVKSVAMRAAVGVAKIPHVAGEVGVGSIALFLEISRSLFSSLSSPHLAIRSFAIPVCSHMRKDERVKGQLLPISTLGLD